MSCVIFHPEMGIYLGSFIGLAFWSKLDVAGQDFAVTFPCKEVADSFMHSWEGGRPKGALCVPVEPDDGNYASVEACVQAGLPRCMFKSERILHA